MYTSSAVPSKKRRYKTVDTSIKHPISGQSTTVVRGCMYIMFDMVLLVMEEY